jgi:hypothetical protein
MLLKEDVHCKYSSYFCYFLSTSECCYCTVNVIMNISCICNNGRVTMNFSLLIHQLIFFKSAQHSWHVKEPHLEKNMKEDTYFISAV